MYDDDPHTRCYLLRCFFCDSDIPYRDVIRKSVKCRITIVDTKGQERTVDSYLCPKCSIRSAKPMGVKSMEAVRKIIIIPDKTERDCEKYKDED